MTKIEDATDKLERAIQELLECNNEEVVLDRLRAAHEHLLRGSVDDGVELVSTGEAARLLGIKSVNTVKRWAQEGLLEGFRRGSRILVSKRSVQRLASAPAVSSERSFDRRLNEALVEFTDEGAESESSTGDLPWTGRKPWESNAGVRG